MHYRRVFLLTFCLVACSPVFYETVLSEETKPVVYDSKGKRDPFVPLVIGETRSYTSLENVETIDDLILEGILWDPKGDSIAILNDVILKEGDEVKNIRILRIAPKRVFLEMDDVKHELMLEERKEGGRK